MLHICTRLAQRYGIALLATVSAFFVALGLGHSNIGLAYALFIGATMASAFQGGMRAGLFATALSLFFLTCLPGQALSGNQISTWEWYPGLAMFVIIGLLASYLCRECRRATRLNTQIYDTISNMRDAAIFVDRRGRISFLNSAAQSFIGIPEIGAAKSVLNTIFRPLDERTHKPLEDPLAPIMSGRCRSIPVTSALISIPERGESPIEFWAESLQDGRGNLKGIFLIVRDIHSRRRSELALAQREQRFHSLASAAPTAMLMVDDGGRCIFSNVAYQAIANCTFAEALGDGWIASIHSEDREVAADWAESARQGKSFAGEFRLEDSQGRSRWMQLRSRPANSDNGSVLGHIGTLEDITFRKHLESEVEKHKHREEALRLAHQQKEQQAATQLEQIEKTNLSLREAIDERDRAQESFRKEQSLREKERKKADQELHRQSEELAEAKSKSQAQMAEAIQKEQSARDELERTVADWRRKQEESSRSLDFYRCALELLPAGIIAWDANRHVAVINRFARQCLGLPHELPHLEGWDKNIDLYQPNGVTRLSNEEDPFTLARQQASVKPIELVAMNKNGTAHNVRVSSEPLRTLDGTTIGSIAAIQEGNRHKELADEFQGTLEIERQHHKHERGLWDGERRTLEQNNSRAKFLAEATRALGSSLDGTMILQNLARVTVPYLADWCVIHRIENGLLMRAAVASSGTLANEDAATLPVDHYDATQLSERVRISQPELFAYVPDFLSGELQRTLNQDSFNNLRAGTSMCVPLVFHAEPIGAISLVRGRSATTYGPEDLTLVEELVQGAILALVNGRLHQEVCTSRDRARRQADHLHEITSSVAHGLIAIDAEGVITYANGVTENLLGWKNSDLHGQRIVDVLGLTAGAADDPRQTIHHVHILFRRKDGSLLPVDCTFAPVLKDDRNTGTVITFQQAIERKTLPDLADGHQQANDLFANKDLFLEGLSSQIGLILRQLEEASGQPGSDEEALAKRRLELNSNLRRLHLLVENLDAALQIAQHRLKLRKEPILLEALMSGAVAACRPAIESRGHLLTVSLPLIAEQLIGDAMRLHQVLANLLDNAARHIPCGGQIDFIAERRDREIILRVRDNGNGFPAERLPEFFVFSANRKSNSEYGEAGLGFGLALVHQLIDMHQGTVHVSSNGARPGCEVVISLPVKEANEEDLSAQVVPKASRYWLVSAGNMLPSRDAD